MANFFSDHYTSSTTLTVAGTSVEVGYKPSLQQKAGREYIRAQIPVTTAAADADIWRLFTVDSGTRLHKFVVSNIAAVAGTGLDLDVGLYLSGNNHDGALLDIDLFGAGASVDGLTTLAQIDLFDLGILVDADRGKTMWELLAIGAGSDTVDPLVQYDICATVLDGDTITTGGSFVFEAEISSAG